MSTNARNLEPKKLQARIEFLDKLANVLDAHQGITPAIYGVTIYGVTAALPSRSLKKILRRRESIQSCSLSFLSLLKQIPNDEDSDFVDAITGYLKSFYALLKVADERYSHLEAKARKKEKYSIFQDLAYLRRQEYISDYVAMYNASINHYRYEIFLALHPDRGREIVPAIFENDKVFYKSLDNIKRTDKKVDL